jgi:hypothetical protein
MAEPASSTIVGPARSKDTASEEEVANNKWSK